MGLCLIEEGVRSSAAKPAAAASVKKIELRDPYAIVFVIVVAEVTCAVILLFQHAPQGVLAVLNSHTRTHMNRYIYVAAWRC